MLHRLAPGLVVVATIVISGASCAPEPRPAPPPEASTSRPEPAQPSVAERAEACARAVESLAPDAEPQLAMRVVAEGCLPVYREPGCRQGMQRAIAPTTDPSERVVIMSDACSKAYCPKLPEPRPAFCSAPSDRPPSERMKLYGPFRDAMLEYELGREGKVRVLGAFEAAAQRRRAATESSD